MNKIFRNILCVGSAIAVIAFTIDFSILGLASSHRGDKHAYAIPSEPAPVRFDASVRPLPVSKYTRSHPAASNGWLIWHRMPTAVYYELELLSAPPEEEHTITLSEEHHLFSTKEIYTNAWQADFTPYSDEPVLYWRVRAIDFFGNPIGAFSTAEPIHINQEAVIPEKPLLNTIDRDPDRPVPLYPVYDWLPLHDSTVHYEVELLSAPPEHENNTIPSVHRIWHSESAVSASYYDDFPRSGGDYWWRVRAVDEAGNTIGVYSDSQKMTVAAPDQPLLAASFGDSITHGGGALSYSPADPEYSYESYLDFESPNLGRSGDTTRMSAERFEQDVLPYHPANLLILCGSNDLRDPGISAEDTIAELEKIRLACEHNNIRPIFLTLMPINPENIYRAFQTETDENWHEKMDTINAFIREQPYYIDLEPYFYNRSGQLARKYATDGLHGDILGKKLMAEIINEHQDLLLQP